MQMKIFKSNLKKITGLLGALLFAVSLMIGPLPADALANQVPGEEESCGICKKGGDCVTSGVCGLP
jgi:preprotein translocase subunit SecG